MAFLIVIGFLITWFLLVAVITRLNRIERQLEPPDARPEVLK
jgi:hypothetical protein